MNETKKVLIEVEVPKGYEVQYVLCGRDNSIRTIEDFRIINTAPSTQGGPIKRYRPFCAYDDDGTPYADMIDTPNGEYVHHEDFASHITDAVSSQQVSDEWILMPVELSGGMPAAIWSVLDDGCKLAGVPLPQDLPKRIWSALLAQQKESDTNTPPASEAQKPGDGNA